jgi:predicted flap endonuclease-1-like 5' DNA nuclease
MAYLIEHLFGWLVIVGVLCAVSGWAMHALRTNAALEERERERDRLRRELVAMVNAELPEGDGAVTKALERELDTLRTRCDINLARIAELENHLVSARDQRDLDLGEIAELRRRLESQVHVATPLSDGGADEEELETQRRLNWRLRYFEARAAHLQPLADRPALPSPAPAPDPGLLEALAEARARADQAAETIQALEAERASAAAEPAFDPAPLLADKARLADDLRRMGWHVRYLQARVRYLEAHEPAAPAATGPSEEELAEQRRQVWRARYLAARVTHLEEALGAARAEMETITVLRARILDLEASEVTALELASQADANAAANAARAATLERALDEARAAVAGLEDRTGALTAQLADIEAERDRLSQALGDLRAAPQQRDTEADELRWRAGYLASRVRRLEAASDASVPAPNQAPPPEPEAARLVPTGAEVRPEGLGAPRAGAPDDLRLIDGVGPRLETTLHSLGVYHFDQIAAWTPANIAWVDQYLRFRGRIVRERWVEQARAIAGGVSLGRLTAADEMA